MAVLATGCGILRKPDMSHTSGIAHLQKPRHPLILIPGFLGTKLRDRKTHKVAWGTMANIFTGRENDALALPLNSEYPDAAEGGLEPYQIYGSLWGVDYYSKILRSLQDAGGYQLGDIEHPKPGDNAFVFIYDWRQDNVVMAGQFAQVIARLKAALADPDVTFDLITHSQGGLIARYYVKYGGADILDSETPPPPTLAGAADIHRVIMLGTPNRGCLGSLKNLHLGIKKYFRPMLPEVVFTMPSLYEMLPPRGSVLFAHPDGTPFNLDLYDPHTWIREAWSVFSPEAQERLRKKLARKGGSTAALEESNRRSLEFLTKSLRRAERFHQALNAPAAGDSKVAYYAFGSDCISTLKTAVVLDRGSRHEILFDNEQFRREKMGDRLAKILYGPGDGTVLMQSLLDIPDAPEGRKPPRDPGSVEFNSAFFICESHGLLPNDPIFQNNLFYILLWDGDRPTSPTTVTPNTGS